MKKNKSFLIYPLLIMGAFLLLVTGCRKEDPKYEPSLSTAEVISVTQTTAVGGGTITDNGGEHVTARGIVWSTDQEPTLENNTGKTTDGSGTGIWTSQLTELTPNTTYFVKAYATNVVGTAYGNQVNFTTEEGDPSVTDIEGNTYAAVEIGDQLWMAENLKTTKYNDGAAIPLVENSAEWVSLNTGGYCWYNNDKAANENLGVLYNWHAVNTGKLCPTGWHVPNYNEWVTLTDYVGGVTVAGSKLKTTTGWYNNGNGTDEYGFSAIPSGIRIASSGNFGYLGQFGYFWTSSTYADDPTKVWYRNCGYSIDAVSNFNGSKMAGISIRCIKDN